MNKNENRTRKLILAALADLLSYPEWTIPTLIIKSLMGYVCARIAGSAEAHRLKSARIHLAVLAALVIMVAGYTVFGAILYGSLATGLSQVPGLTAEAIVGAILFYAVGGAFETVVALRTREG